MIKEISMEHNDLFKKRLYNFYIDLKSKTKNIRSDRFLLKKLESIFKDEMNEEHSSNPLHTTQYLSNFNDVYRIRCCHFTTYKNVFEEDELKKKYVYYFWCM